MPYRGRRMFNLLGLSYRSLAKSSSGYVFRGRFGLPELYIRPREESSVGRWFVPRSSYKSPIET